MICLSVRCFLLLVKLKLCSMKRFNLRIIALPWLQGKIYGRLRGPPKETGGLRKMTTLFRILYIYIYMTFCTYACYVSVKFNWLSHKHHNSDLIHLQCTKCGPTVCNLLVLSTKDITRIFFRHQFISKATLSLKKKKRENLCFSQKELCVFECLMENIHSLQLLQLHAVNSIL